MGTLYNFVSRKPRIMLIYVLNIFGPKKNKVLHVRNVFWNTTFSCHRPVTPNPCRLQFFPGLIQSLKRTFPNFGILLL